jgi:large subunit ribosomal protein L23
MSKEHLMKVLLSPVVTEKATMAGETNNQYVFEVLPSAAKPEIKAAVEQMFNVKVESVTVTNVKGKVKRFGQRPGRRKNWKKAYVRLQAGQEINLAGGE